MPLLISPIDNKTPMQQLHYKGIEIDRCPVSGGVWLDAGELEKLLNNMNEAIQEDRKEFHHYRQENPHYQHPQPMAHPRSYKQHDDYDNYYHKKHGKKSGWREIFDVFD